MLFRCGQNNSNDAGIFPAPLFDLTHILTHNTAIHNGQDDAGGRLIDGLSFAKMIIDAGVKSINDVLEYLK